MELTVIIPTRDRQSILSETLDRLERQPSDVRFEVVVADDGSTDGTSDVVRTQAERRPYRLRLVELPGLGPAAARNRALAVAEAPVCLFVDDDCWPRPGLLERHRDFHARHPEREAALLGFIGLAPTPPPTELMRWLAEVHLDFEGIADADDAGGDHFFTGNVSAKTALLRDAGGFDEALGDGEDIDLGLRLERAGMRLAYDPGAAVEHCSPIDLPRALARMSSVGRAFALLGARHAGYPEPTRPALRHRARAGALTLLAAAGVRTPALRRETWRFLCDQAVREAYWNGVGDGLRGGDAGAAAPRVGRTLARLARRDDEARMPAGGPTANGP
jgi:glycosyltransferase involved in cell wall biosynthesis